MRFLAYLRSLATRFFHRSQVEDEMEKELRSHIAHRADDLERSGLNRAEAERRARIEFGGHERFKEECREALGEILLRRWHRMCGSVCGCYGNLQASAPSPS